MLGLLARRSEGQELLASSSTQDDRKPGPVAGAAAWREPPGRVPRGRRFDKREVWVQGVFNPIVDATGKPFKVVAYLNDVTRQRQEALLNAAFRGALDRLDANVMVRRQRPEDHLREPRRRAHADARAGIVPRGPAGLRCQQADGREPRVDDARTGRTARRDRNASRKSRRARKSIGGRR